MDFGVAEDGGCMTVDKVEDGSTLVDGKCRRTVNGFIMGDMIGAGSFGKVYRAWHGDVTVALKEMSRKALSAVVFFGPGGRIARRTAVDDLRKEISIHRMLRHPNIITLHQVWEDANCDPIFLVFDLADHVAQVIEMGGEPTTPLPQSLLALYMRDLAAGVHYLHSNLVIHRDIKPANLLIQDGRLKIGDFGVSERISSLHERIRKQVGTMAFWAPELCSDEDGVDFEGPPLDMWAVGITLFCFGHGRLPYASKDQLGLVDEIVQKEIEIPQDTERQTAAALEGLLCVHPGQRTRSDELLNMMQKWAGPSA